MYLPCPHPPKTQQDFLDLFRRLLPSHYIDSLQNPGPGYEVLQAFAKVLERISLATQRLCTDAFILSANGAVYALGSVELYRDAPNAEAISVTIKAGSLVMASKSGRKFVTLTDVTFGPADLGPFTVNVSATIPGFEFNLPGEVLAADGTVLEGEIDTVDQLVEVPELGDLTIKVRQTATATTGGVDPALDQHGEDRGLPREQGEADVTYRDRIRRLPDNISPGAVERTVLFYLEAYGVAWSFIELWDIGFQTCWSAPAEEIPGSTFDPNLFAYNDPRPVPPYRNRWLSADTARGGFVVVVGAIPAIEDRGMTFNDPGTVPSNFQSPTGRWAVPAWSVPASLTTAELAGVLNGVDSQKLAVYKGLDDTLQKLKAAGVFAGIAYTGV